MLGAACLLVSVYMMPGWRGGVGNPGLAETTIARVVTINATVSIEPGAWRCVRGFAVRDK